MGSVPTPPKNTIPKEKGFPSGVESGDSVDFRRNSLSDFFEQALTLLPSEDAYAPLPCLEIVVPDGASIESGSEFLNHESQFLRELTYPSGGELADKETEGISAGRPPTRSCPPAGAENSYVVRPTPVGSCTYP